MRILRGLRSQILPCGCLAGVYETYDGEVVTMLDERAETCLEPRHQNGSVLPNLAGDARLPEDSGSPDRPHR